MSSVRDARITALGWHGPRGYVDRSPKSLERRNLLAADVNGDGVLSPSDALLIANAINAQGEFAGDALDCLLHIGPTSRWGRSR